MAVMFPVLFSFGHFTLYTMSVFSIIAFFVTGFVFWRKGREEHYAEDEIFDVFLLSLLWGFLWSRIGFIAVHYQHFGLNFGRWVDVINYPGVLPLAGILAGLWFLFLRAKREKWDAFEVLDFGVLALTAGYMILWLGAFFDGSSFGFSTNLPWGMSFPAVFDRRHPTQIYGFLLYLFLFIFLSWAEPRYRTFSWYRDKRHSAQTGFLTCCFFMMFGLIGIFFHFVAPSQVVIRDIDVDLIIRGLLIVFGLLLLFTRTGRSLWPKRLSRSHKPAPLILEEKSEPTSPAPTETTEKPIG